MNVLIDYVKFNDEKILNFKFQFKLNRFKQLHEW